MRSCDEELGDAYRYSDASEEEEGEGYVDEEDVVNEEEDEDQRRFLEEMRSELHSRMSQRERGYTVDTCTYRTTCSLIERLAHL